MAQDEKTTKTTSQEEIGKEQTETKTGGELAKPQQMIGNYPVDVRVGKNGKRHGQFLLRPDAERLFAFMRKEAEARRKYGLECHR